MNEVCKSQGHKENCAEIVSIMLGADVTDLGYPENYCILEEYSLQLILDFAKGKGMLKNIQFVSAAGVSRVVNLAETIKEIVNLNTLIKCNPYYGNKYLIIVDNLSDLSPEEMRRIQPIKTRISNRFIELNHKSLEEYYSNLNEDIYQEALKEISVLRGRDKGIAKAKYAERIIKLLQKKDDFSKLFNHELDFLLL